MEKIKNIEILRFLFALVIVYFHLQYGIVNLFQNGIPLYNQILNNVKWSSLPVDFFFIISGFFLFLKTDFSQDFITFAKKKLIRFMPNIIFILILIYICSFFTPLEFLKYENIFTILNIQNVGLTYKYGNLSASWFISSLFWGLSFYFYLYKSVDKKIFNLITACIVFFCYSMWIHTKGDASYINVAYVFNKGMIRALSSIGVGYFLSMVYKDNIQQVKEMTLNIWQKLLFTAAEVYLFCFIFYYLVFHPINYDNRMIMIIAFIFLFSLFVIKKGYFSKLLENNISVFLGQFAFSIFLTHQFIRSLWKYYVCKAHSQWVIAHSVENLVLFFTVVILFGVFTYYFVEKPSFKYLKEKFLK